MQVSKIMRRPASVVGGRASRCMLSSTPAPNPDLGKHTSRNAPRPMAQFFRSSWPDAKPAAPAAEAVLPKRTVSDDVLQFTLTASTQHGSAIFYPHMKLNPADRKVRMDVALRDLGLTPEQEKVFIAMVGPRYSPGNKMIRLTADQFANRIENKRYLVTVLENLLAETRRLAALKL